MRWIRVIDKLPAENQEVLLRCRAVVYLAVYDRKKNIFLVKDGTEHDPEKEELYWLELMPAPPSFSTN